MKPMAAKRFTSVDSVNGIQRHVESCSFRQEEEPMDKEKMMQASKTLADLAKTKREESLAAQTTHYQDLMTTLGEQEEFFKTTNR